MATPTIMKATTIAAIMTIIGIILTMTMTIAMMMMMKMIIKPNKA